MTAQIFFAFKYYESLKKKFCFEIKKKNLYLLGKRPIESVKTQSHMKQRT